MVSGFALKPSVLLSFLILNVFDEASVLMWNLNWNLSYRIPFTCSSSTFYFFFCSSLEWLIIHISIFRILPENENNLTTSNDIICNVFGKIKASEHEYWWKNVLIIFHFRPLCFCKRLITSIKFKKSCAERVYFGIFERNYAILREISNIFRYLWRPFNLVQRKWSLK